MTDRMDTAVSSSGSPGFALERIRFTVPTLVLESERETEGEIPDVEMGLVSEVAQPLVLENGNQGSNPDSPLALAPPKLPILGRRNVARLDSF